MTFVGLFCLLLWASGALAGPKPPDGAALYSRHCAACHGETGHGGVGVPLALPDFLASVTDDYLVKTVRMGRPGRVMPAFSRLTEAEVGSIVHHIRTFAAKLPAVLPSTPVRGDPVHGKELYARHCAACHGPNGEGGKGTGVTFSRPRDLPIIAPALHNPGFLKAASDQMIKMTLMKGREGTPMTSFLDKGLSETDIDDVVSYIRSFEQEPVAGGSSVTPKADEPVLVVESPYGLEETVENVKRAAAGRNFRFIRRQYLNEGLAEPGKEDKHQVVVYFCNFQFLYEALALDPRVGLFLPCQATVMERAGKVRIMTINPKRLSALYNNSELNRACDEMYRIYREILEEATL